ncbi:lipopolysaccharide biosynthesis protein [Aliiroseovarius sp. YM-037]|uniref:lipopolysaccharide biosynthesis protein n=1 Tax=Aliiroseovarius sp. YM-037 TaxID=3341728 RepID=UPI003A80062E
MGQATAADSTSGAEPRGYHPHMSRGRSRAAVIGVLWSSLHTLLPTISSAVVFVIGAYFLSPSDFGLIGLATALVSVAIAFSPLAFGEALIQRELMTKDHADSVFWLTVGFGLIAMQPFVFGGSLIATWMEEPALAFLLPVLALRIPLELSAAVPNALIVRSMRFKLLALRTSVASLVSITISLAMLFAGYGYWALVVSQVSASFVICAMAFWVTRWRPGRAFRLGAVRELARYGVFASGNRMLDTIRLDHIVLGALAGTQILGLYFFAQRCFMILIQLVSGALSSVTHALLSTLQGDRDKARQAFMIASFASTAVSLPMFAGVALVIDDVLAQLLDPKWGGAAFPIQAFCALGVLASIGVIQGALIKSQGHANWWFYYQLLQQGTTVLTIMLTFHYGLTTMMTALVLKSLIVWPVSVWMTTALLDCKPLAYLSEFRDPILATVVMSAAVLGVAAVDVAPAVTLPFQILVGAVVYAATLFTLSHRRVGRVLAILRKPERSAA